MIHRIDPPRSAIWIVEIAALAWLVFRSGRPWLVVGVYAISIGADLARRGLDHWRTLDGDPFWHG